MVYDYLIVTHLPSFYKVNLYRALSKTMRIAVIYLGEQSTIRTPDFIARDAPFDTFFLSQGSFETRNVWYSSALLVKHLATLRFKRLIISGWEEPEFWLSAFFNRKSKNFLCLESGSESQTTGLKGLIKKIFLSRIHKILATGVAQITLARTLGFSSTVIKTHGVGLPSRSRYRSQRKPFRGRFLYVGRFSPEKNLSVLFDAFKQLPDYRLSLAGQGPVILEAQNNVTFLGHIPQTKMHQVYADHDVLILPSTHETWGLVVEEALHYGLPVIVSNRVGAKELVETYETGLTFDPYHTEDLVLAIRTMAKSECYDRCCANLQHFDAFKRSEDQLKAYEMALL